MSFQMSFSAVLALISGYETIRPWLRRLYGRSWPKRLASYVAALALTSTLAGTASLPYGAYHFGHVQIYYILSNLIAVLLQKMNFPQYAPDGQPLSYKIHHRGSGKQLLDNQTLGEVGVKSGDILRLQPEITAGVSRCSWPVVRCN